MIWDYGIKQHCSSSASNTSALQNILGLARGRPKRYYHSGIFFHHSLHELQCSKYIDVSLPTIMSSVIAFANSLDPDDAQ